MSLRVKETQIDIERESGRQRKRKSVIERKSEIDRYIGREI